jgi:hypothetical protein
MLWCNLQAHNMTACAEQQTCVLSTIPLKPHLELPRTPTVRDGCTGSTLNSLEGMQHQRERIPITLGNLQLHVHTTAAEAHNASTQLQALPWRQLHTCAVAAAVAVR